MAWGLQISTTRGMSDLSNIRALRLVWSRLCNTSEGSVSLPSGLGVGSIVSVNVHDNKEEPNVSLGASTVSWTSSANAGIGQAPSVNFTLNLYKVR